MKKLFKVLCCIIVALSMVFGSLSVCAINDTYIDVNTSILISLFEGESKCFTFTPSETAVYRFYSQGEADTYAVLLDSDDNTIAESDDGYIDCNFDILALLEKDQTYTLYCELYFTDESGDFLLTLEKTDIKSIEFNDVTVYQGIDSETVEYEIIDGSNGSITSTSYFVEQYYYSVTFAITLTNGDILYSDEDGSLEYDGGMIYSNVYDDQDYDNEWGLGEHSAMADVLGFSQAITVTVELPDSVHGDINMDESINNKDLGLLMQYLNNWDVEINIDAADVNGDSSVNNKDYGLLMQYLNNWDVELVGPSVKPDENPDETPGENPAADTDVTVVDALNYTKNVIPRPGFEGWGYEEMEHRVILPRITSETENSKAFNQKMYDSFSYAYDALINNEEYAAMYDISYQYKIDNSVIGIFITNRHAVQAGGGTWFYEAFYYDIENDKEITLDEYVAAFGFTVSELFKLIKTTDEYKFAYEYAYGDISIRDCIIDDRGLYVRFNDSDTMDGWSELEIADFLNRI